MSIKPEELKPCPFCGKEPDIRDGDSLYPTGTGWKDEGEYRSYHKGSEVPKEQWCYAAGCSELSGGCSAEVFGDTRQEAIDKWNARAIPDTHRVVTADSLAVDAEIIKALTGALSELVLECMQGGAPSNRALMRARASLPAGVAGSVCK